MIRFRKLYEELLRRLDPYQLESPDQLSKTVVPVAIVEDLSAVEIPTTIIGNGLFSGNSAAAAPVTIATTGNLQAGTYEGEWYVHWDSVANFGTVELQHLTAADAVIDAIRTRVGWPVAGVYEKLVSGHFSAALALNEELRIQLLTRSAGLDACYGTIVLRKTS